MNPDSPYSSLSIRDTATELIVIGGGIAGLAAAASLARAGRKTVLLEQHHQPGGYRSLFVRRGGVFDITPHWTTDPGRVNALLAEHGVGPPEFERHAYVPSTRSHPAPWSRPRPSCPACTRRATGWGLRGR